MNITEKYKPTSIQGLIGNSKQANDVFEFVKDFYTPERQNSVIVVSGPTGTGKNLSIELIARHFGYDYVEYSDIDDAMKTANQLSMFSKGKIVGLDLDCCTNLRNLKAFTEKSRHPTALLTLDIWDKRYANIRNSYRAIKFFKLNSLSLESFMKRICTAENIPFGSAIKELAKKCDGDARFAILSIDSLRDVGITSETIQSVGRDGDYSVFDVMNSIFYGNADADKLRSVDSFMLMNQLRNKVSDVYRGEKLAHAFSCIAKAELFQARIRKRQAWNLEKYYYDFISFIGKH